MAIPASMLTTTCDVYRPFGAGAPTTTAVACRLVPRPSRDMSLAGPWTHYIDIDDSVDLRDGCGRALGGPAQLYADGDEVRIPNASGTRYVVVWVVMINAGSPHQFKRAYLARDTAVWPGP